MNEQGTERCTRADFADLKQREELADKDLEPSGSMAVHLEALAAPQQPAQPAEEAMQQQEAEEVPEAPEAARSATSLVGLPATSALSHAVSPFAGMDCT